MSFLNKNKFLILIILIILTSKILLLFIFPRELYFYVTGLTKFNYYNTLAFSTDMQAFRDANHPGTPIYMLGSFFLKLIGNEIKDFNKYFYLHHIFLTFFNIFCICIFFNYFKKFLKKIEIASFLLFFISTFNFLFGLEIISLMAYQFGIALLLMVYFVKSLNKNKLIKLSAICAFAISCKMTFLPFVLSIFIAKTFFFILKKNFLKNILSLSGYTSFFYLLFNFPIIGRIPKIFLDVLFLREDTSLEIKNIFSSLNYSINQLLAENFFILFINLFSLVLLFIILITYIFNLKASDKKSQTTVLLIFCLQITIFYIYTFVVAGQTYGDNINLNNLEKENFFRNNYPYLIFVFTTYLASKYYFKFKLINQKLLFLICIFSFLLNFINYTINKKIIVNDKLERQKLLIDEVSKYINIETDVLAYFTYSLGYGFGNEIFHLNGNSLEGNEYFTEEIVNLYPNFRYFRFNDVDRIIKNENNKVFNEKSSISKFKSQLKKVDKYLMKFFPNEIYEILSYKSKNSSMNKSIIRSNEIYSLQNNKNFKKPNVIMYSDKNIPLDYINEKEVYKYLKTKMNISKRIKFNVKDDNWYIYFF
tara:strand:- start:764 stop:2536 length:1773 start_codon:yes stop_codon:yes gene_type:complete